MSEVGRLLNKANQNLFLLLERNGAQLWGSRLERVQQYLRRLAKKAGLGDVKVMPHVLRHTFGTNAAARGVNAFILKEMMGHSSIQTTSRYTHPQPDDLKAQHNMFSMVNELFKKK